jgi:hypothetical protein
MRWSFSEFDARLNLVPWIVWQIEDSYSKMTKLVGHEKSMFSGLGGTI